MLLTPLVTIVKGVPVLVILMLLVVGRSMPNLVIAVPREHWVAGRSIVHGAAAKHRDRGKPEQAQHEKGGRKRGTDGVGRGEGKKGWGISVKKTLRKTM